MFEGLSGTSSESNNTPEGAKKTLAYFFTNLETV